LAIVPKGGEDVNCRAAGERAEKLLSSLAEELENEAEMNFFSAQGDRLKSDPERSEGSRKTTKILRFAQNDVIKNETIPAQGYHCSRKSLSANDLGYGGRNNGKSVYGFVGLTLADLRLDLVVVMVGVFPGNGCQ
jgi:hypothetical protein